MRETPVRHGVQADVSRERPTPNTGCPAARCFEGESANGPTGQVNYTSVTSQGVRCRIKGRGPREGSRLGRILAIEDDAAIRGYVALGLRERGHVVDEAASLADGRVHIGRDVYDLWIFDRRLPDGDSLTVLSELRAKGLATPALFLSAAAELDQRIAGLEAGADDYLTKPFSLVELTARVKALLRRRPTFIATNFVIGNLTVSIEARSATIDGCDFAVTAHEWRLLALLCEHPGRVFLRDTIIAHVGIAVDADPVAVDHLVSRLRQKLRTNAATVEIRTLRGQGYSVSLASA